MPSEVSSLLKLQGAEFQRSGNGLEVPLSNGTVRRGSDQVLAATEKPAHRRWELETAGH